MQWFAFPLVFLHHGHGLPLRPVLHHPHLDLGHLPRIGALSGTIFGNKLLVMFLGGRLVLIGVVFASILVLLERLLPENCPKKFSFCQVLFFSARSLLLWRRCRRCSRLSCFSCFSLSLSFPIFLSVLSRCLCRLEKRKIRLLGHTTPPSHVPFGLFFSCCCPLCRLLFPPVSAMRPLVSVFFSGCVS